VGMASGNGLAGAAAGVNVDANNRQLHPTEIQWIQARSNSFAKKLYGTDKPTSEQIAQAQQYLVYAGLGNISDSDQKANVLQGMQKDENYIEAKKFLNNQPDVFINDQGKAQRVFTVQAGEFYDPLKYSQYNADPAYRDFMWASAGLNYAPPASASAQEKTIYEQRESERLARDFKGALPGLIPGAMAIGTGVALNRTPAVKSVAGSKLESSPGATTLPTEKTRPIASIGESTVDQKTFRNQFPEDTPRPPKIIPNEQLLMMSQKNLAYVVKEDGTLVVGRNNQYQGHIDLANGEPVLAAGELRIHAGEIKYIDNNSGHYRPSGIDAQRAAEKAFSDIGFKVEGKYIERPFK
jgi:hypothetical protein